MERPEELVHATAQCLHCSDRAATVYLDRIMPDEKSVDRKSVNLEALDHNGQRRIALCFPYDIGLIAIAKRIGAQWSRSHKCWHVENGSASMKAIFAAYKGSAWGKCGCAVHEEEKHASSSGKTDHHHSAQQTEQRTRSAVKQPTNGSAAAHAAKIGDRPLQPKDDQHLPQRHQEVLPALP
jgi:hypothetical protein